VIEIVANEIEKGADVGISDAFGVGIVTFGESIQKPQDIIGCYLVDLKITEFKTEVINDRLIGSNRVFFWNGPCGNRSRLWPLLRLSWLPPLVWGLTCGVYYNLHVI
jgi:hypothetical protein